MQVSVVAEGTTQMRPKRRIDGWMGVLFQGLVGMMISALLAAGVTVVLVSRKLDAAERNAQGREFTSVSRVVRTVPGSSRCYLAVGEVNYTPDPGVL